MFATHMNGFMITLDVVMIVYTLWVLSLNQTGDKLPLPIGAAMLIWLLVLHLGLSNKILFPEDISGIAFLLVIVIAIALIASVLYWVKPLRERVLGLQQEQLMALQGIRVFYGAGFLMQGALQTMPLMFAVLDGWLHVCAGFLGLIAAFSLATGNYGRQRAWVANLFGLGDILIVASTLSLVLLDELTPYHNMMYAVFLPAPLWLLAHCLSIWKLSQGSDLSRKQVVRD